MKFRPVKLKMVAALILPVLLVSACKKMDDGDASASLPEIAAPELSVDTMRDITKELSSDAYEGRAPGTAGEQKTLALKRGLSRAMEKAGFRMCLWSPLKRKMSHR